jgi:hypothetical protein
VCTLAVEELHSERLAFVGEEEAVAVVVRPDRGVPPVAKPTQMPQLDLDERPVFHFVREQVVEYCEDGSLLIGDASVAGTSLPGRCAFRRSGRQHREDHDAEQQQQREGEQPHVATSILSRAASWLVGWRVPLATVHAAPWGS